MSGLVLQFCYEYTDQNREKLSEYTDEKSLVKYIKKLNLVEKFAQYADGQGLRRRNLMIQQSRTLLEEFITSRIVYNMLDEQSWIEYLNSNDPVVKEAIRVLKEGKAFPKPDDNDNEAASEGGPVAQNYDYRPTHLRTTLVAKG